MSRRLLLTYLLLALFVLAVLEIPLGLSYARNQRSDLSARLEHDATVLATSAENLVPGTPATRDDLRRLVQGYERKTGERYVVVDRRGNAILDSSGEPLKSFASRPEIRAALETRTATGTRYSQTLGERIRYVAVPVVPGGELRGAVRVTYPTAALDRSIRRFWLILAAVAGVIMAAAALVAVQFSRYLTAPLRKLEQVAKAAGGGDLTARADPEGGPPEVRSLARSFNETVRKLEALIRSNEEFVADAAHQLRTPLASLQLGLENLEQEVPVEDSRRVENLQAEVARLSRLVDGLLALARADAATEPPKIVDLAPVVAQRLEAWDTYAAESHVQLSVRIGTDLTARATPDRVEQVLDNLLANALEVSPQAGTITVSGQRTGRWVELHVVDEGPGMTREDRARAFDRLWRARQDGGGAGIGLAIVKRLVSSDGGECELLPASTGGIDAVVRLRATGPLPQARPEPTTDRASALA